MNTRTIPTINLQVRQRVFRNDGVPGTVTAFDRELFNILWDDGTNYHYEENGKWCASWGADLHDLDVHSIINSDYSRLLDELEKLETMAKYLFIACLVGIAGLLVQYIWPA